MNIWNYIRIPVSFPDWSFGPVRTKVPTKRIVWSLCLAAAHQLLDVNSFIRSSTSIVCHALHWSLAYHVLHRAPCSSASKVSVRRCECARRRGARGSSARPHMVSGAQEMSGVLTRTHTSHMCHHVCWYNNQCTAPLDYVGSGLQIVGIELIPMRCYWLKFWFLYMNASKMVINSILMM